MQHTDAHAPTGTRALSSELPSQGALPGHTSSSGVLSSTPPPPKGGAFADFGNGETFVAGAIAGLIAETLLHPMDTASHRAKVHPESAYGGLFGAFRIIWKQEGWRGFTAGVSATMMASPPNNAVYFSTYEIAKLAGLSLTGGHFEPAVYFVSGAASEVAASLFTLPLEVAKSRLQLGVSPHRATGGIIPHHENFPSVRHALVGLYKDRGFRGLYSGWHSVLLQEMCFSATQFTLYEAFKGAVRTRQGGRDPSAGQILAIGCASGGTAALLTNPLDVITTRLLVQGGSGGYGGTSMWAVARHAVSEGPVALWRGTLPRVAYMAPLTAVSFTVYEAVRAFLKGTPLFQSLAEGPGGDGDVTGGPMR